MSSMKINVQSVGVAFIPLTAIASGSYIPDLPSPMGLSHYSVVLLDAEQTAEALAEQSKVAYLT